MRWSWNHATDEVWRQLDPGLWEVTNNPWVVLQPASRERIERVLGDPVFRKNVDGLVEASRQAAEAPAWFQRNHAGDPLTCVAYFSMEFMLSEALPIYSGGLGNVAGDQLKAASDLGVPVVGVGLLYQQGYFRQVIDKSGEQQALYLMFNAGEDTVDFGLPPVLPGAGWYVAVDTSRQPPKDMSTAGQELFWEGPRTYHLSPRSSAILLARRTEAK
jgi:starch phosphorylase